ncbi:flagellar biosynthetic protein FliO [Halobacillus salinarum]|uniref:Flagellar biosynthetic protein FliO n=1 Tax=Halobacillus salinarum TaxID=2932257 RepID=A0ABY4EEZ8_9BACI|nr:flagellar biosynthetic protein FliO [Halobacillus salinarum]UOQ43044.1 flagellar biosynthetic protein FliO [Halobacillus salinarum]
MTLVVAFILCIFQGSVVYAAGPSVSECAKNPQLEGCGTQPDNVEQKTDPSSAEDQQTTAGTEQSSLVWSIIRLIFVLLFVLALIYGLLKFFNSKNKLFRSSRTMENLGGMNLAPNRSIQAVRIGKQVFIVGVGESVDIITEITDEETKDRLLKTDEETAIQQAFGLEKWLDKLKGKQASPEKDSSVQFKQLFEKQLTEMSNNRKQLRKKQQEDRENE